MKRLSLMALLLMMVVGGCTTGTQTAVQSADYTPTEDLAESYATWQTTDPAIITPEEEESLTNLQNFLTSHQWPDWPFIQLFPWIDPNDLTAKDLIFLIRTSKELGPYINWGLLG